MDIKLTGLANLIQPAALTSRSAQKAQSSEAPKVKQATQDAKANSMPEPVNLGDHKAVFALQGNDHVVIQFLDKNGEVVKQIPPKAVIEAYEQLKQALKGTIDNEA